MSREIKNNQQELRDQLKELLLNLVLTIHEVADDIGISPITLSRFLKGGDLSITPLMKIEKWLKTKHIEEKNGNNK